MRCHKRIICYTTRVSLLGRRSYCDVTPESRNSEARARRPVISNNYVDTKFTLQQLVDTHFRCNEYAGINERVTQEIDSVYMATADNNGTNLVFCLRSA
jgi:hypothetical protein